MPVTNFFWEPLSDNILQERDEFGALTAEYTTEPGLYGSVVSQDRSGVESQFHFDAVGSTLALTNAGQQVTDTKGYSAFGEITESIGSTVFPFQYVGQNGYYRGLLSGDYVVRVRPYSALRSRWLAVDRKRRRRAARSCYTYCLNSPTHFTDPSGYDVQPRPGPATPISPGVDCDTQGCDAYCIDYAVYYQSAAGRGDWRAGLMLNVKVTGHPSRNCAEGRTHTVSLTLFATVKAGIIAPGVPPVDEEHEPVQVPFFSTVITSTCSLEDRKTQDDPVAGWFTDFTLHCFSPCDKCDKCLPVTHEATIGFESKLIPAVDAKWTFTPKDLDDMCNYDNCAVQLSVRQQ